MRIPALLLLALTTGSSLCQELAILQLRHRTAEEIAPLIQPLLKPGDTLVPHRTRLIVRSDPATLDEIQAILKQIDHRPHRLRVSVRQLQNQSAEVLRGSVVAKSPSHIRGHVEFHEEREREQADQFVHTLDGQPALIETGEVRPLTFGYSGYVTYQSATTGFAVTPRLTDQGSVQLSIEPWSGRFQQDSRVSLQHSATHTHAVVGAWVEIVGTNQTQTVEHAGQSGTRQETARVFIRIEDLDAGKD